MTEVELLTRQTENAYEWTNKLIESVPFSKWDDTPSGVDTNITWQVGHLIMNHYFNELQSAWAFQWKFGVGHWTFDIESDRRHYLTTKKTNTT